MTQEIKDKIAEIYPNSEKECVNLLHANQRVAAQWGYSLAEPGIAALKAEIERLNRLITDIIASSL